MGKILGEEGARELITKVQSVACNPNLLDNWYFARPVNQLNLTHYGPNQRGGPDRWVCEDVTCDIIDGGISVTWTGSSNWCFIQYIETPTPKICEEMFLGKTFTSSLLTTDGKLVSSTIKMRDTVSDDDNYVIYWDKTHTVNDDNIPVSLEMNIRFHDTGNQIMRCCFTETTPINILAMKVEYGDTQTLARKEGGKWVLNEIPSYAEELNKSLRYQVILPGPLRDKTFASAGVGHYLTNRQGLVDVPLPMPLRATPTVRQEGHWFLADSGWPGPLEVNIGTNQYSDNNLSVYATLTDAVVDNIQQDKVYSLVCVPPGDEIPTRLIIDANF